MKMFDPSSKIKAPKPLTLVAIFRQVATEAYEWNALSHEHSYKRGKFRLGNSSSGMRLAG